MSKYNKKQILKKIKKGENLQNANLSRADLSHVNFNKIDLSRANLYGADLRGADLSGVNLFGANLAKADLSKANLIGIDLSEADLTKAEFREANLYGANLFGANLLGAIFEKANLSGAYLKKTNLNVANLRIANLSGANLSGAILIRANLYMANLAKANLCNSFLNLADFEYADLTGADVSGTNIFHTKTFGWVINEIQCINIYHCPDLNLWKDLEEREKYRHDFAPGEFESRFKTLPIIELTFQQHFTLQNLNLLSAVIEKINQRLASPLDITEMKIGVNTTVFLTGENNEVLKQAAKMFYDMYQKIEQIQERISKQSQYEHLLEKFPDKNRALVKQRAEQQAKISKPTIFIKQTSKKTGEDFSSELKFA